MRYRTLGPTGVQVSTLCLGAMMFGAWGNRDHDDSVAVIRAGLDAGINFIDTADVYSGGESEEIVAKAIAGRRDEVVLATKCHFPVGFNPVDRAAAKVPLNTSGNSRRYIKQAVEASLRRLGTDRIDLYQIHRPDPRTDVEETLSALTDLVREGKVLSLGSSTFPAEQVVEAQWAARERGLERFVCEQPPYSIFTRGIERSVLPTIEKHRMAAIVWSPLGGGWLTGRYTNASGVDLSTGRAARIPARFDPSVPGNQRKLDLVDDLLALAQEVGVPLTHLAIAFTLAHPAVTAAIIGPRTMEQLTTLLGSEEVRLSDDVLDRIDALVPPGTNLTEADGGYEPPSITDKRTRRR